MRKIMEIDQDYKERKRVYDRKLEEFIKFQNQ